MRYPKDVAEYMKRIYLAKVIAAYLCAPQNDDDDEGEEEFENGISIES